MATTTSSPSTADLAAAASAADVPAFGVAASTAANATSGAGSSAASRPATVGVIDSGNGSSGVSIAGPDYNSSSILLLELEWVGRVGIAVGSMSSWVGGRFSYTIHMLSSESKI